MANATLCLRHTTWTLSGIKPDSYYCILFFRCWLFSLEVYKRLLR